MTDIGLWLDNDLWKHWDTDLAKYVPLRVAAGIVTNGVLHKATLAATNTAGDITLSLPGKTGTLALLDDVGAAQATDTEADNSLALDWNSAKIYDVISGNLVVSNGTGAADGKSIELFVETPVGHGVALTITFPSTWRVYGGTLSTTDATHRAIDKFWIERIGNDTFVSKVAAFSVDQSGLGGDTTPPVYISSSIVGGFSRLTVVFSELITGTTTPAKWIVKKNGNTQTIDDTSISGANVLIDLASTVGANSSVTVQYTGTTEVRDLAGNFAAPFAAQTADVIGN